MGFFKDFINHASGERSFSKLKLIKTYLRLSMSQERLSSLPTLSIENSIAQNLDFSELIKKLLQARMREKSTLIKTFL
jgi:hypothetical protein